MGGGEVFIVAENSCLLHLDARGENNTQNIKIAANKIKTMRDER